MKPQKTAQKKSKKATNKRNLKYTSKVDILYLIPVIIAIAVVPLIVHMKINVLEGIQKDVWSGGDRVADFFTYYKYVVLILAAVSGIFSLLIKKMSNELVMKRTAAYIPLAVYALFIMLSTILSQYKDVATTGFVDRFEGVYALLGYVALAIVTLNLVETEHHLKFVINALLISSAIIGLIGLSQFLGKDFFGTSIGKSILLPAEYLSSSNDLVFKFEKFRVFSTLYNPNYVGSYTALVFPVCTGIFLYEKNIIKKVLSGILACILLLCLIGSESMAGLVGLAIVIVMLAIFFRRIIIRYIKPVIIVCVSALILLLAVNYLTGGSISHRLNILGKISVNGQALGEAYVKDIVLKDNTMKIITDKQSVLLQIKNDVLSFYDENNEELVSKQNQGVLTFNDPKYSIYKFQTSDQGLIDCFIGTKTFKIAISETGFKLVGVHRKLLEVTHPERIGFEQQESVLTARGFIWSRTIPLLKETIFVGHGPDTFAIYFPQEDIIGKLNAYGTSDMIVDKPHNLYLQMAMNTGIPSMLAFVALLLMYFITSFKLYFKRNITDYKDYIGISVFCAICGYCVTGLANDSVVSVAPVFWVMLGLGIACNIMFKNKADIAVNKNILNSKANSYVKK